MRQSPPPPVRVIVIEALIFGKPNPDNSVRISKAAAAVNVSVDSVGKTYDVYRTLIERCRQVVAENERLKGEFEGIAKANNVIVGDFFESWEQVTLQSLENMQALGLLQLSEI